MSHYLSGDTLLELQVRNRDPYWSKKPVEKVDSLPMWAFDKFDTAFLEKYSIKLSKLYELRGRQHRNVQKIGW